MSNLFDFDPASHDEFKEEFNELIVISNKDENWQDFLEQNYIRLDHRKHIMNMLNLLGVELNPFENQDNFKNTILKGVNNSKNWSINDKVKYSDNMGEFLAKLIFSAVILEKNIEDHLDNFCRKFYISWSPTSQIDMQILIQFFKRIPQCSASYAFLTEFQGTHAPRKTLSGNDMREMYSLILKKTMSVLLLLYRFFYCCEKSVDI